MAEAVKRFGRRWISTLRFPKPERLTKRQKRKLHDHVVWGTVYSALTLVIVGATWTELFGLGLIGCGYIMFFLIANLTDPRLKEE